MDNIFYRVKTALEPRLLDVLAELLPDGKVQGHEYICASLEGGVGTSCSTNITTGKGSDFATGEKWGDIIALAAKVWNVKQYEAAKRLSEQYGIVGTDSLQKKQQSEFIAIVPIPTSAPQPPKIHHQYGKASKVWAYKNAKVQVLHYVYRFETAQGKIVLPLSYGKQGKIIRWFWKALASPRP